MKTFCYGETLELICPDFSQLKVEGASYNILRAGSKLCAHVNITASSCHAVNVTKRVKAKCQDQLKCSVSNEAEKFGNGECKKSLYLTVLYTCGECFLNSCLVTLTKPGSLEPILDPVFTTGIYPGKLWKRIKIYPYLSVASIRCSSEK